MTGDLLPIIHENMIKKNMIDKKMTFYLNR